MKFCIKHELKGRLRISFAKKSFDVKQADMLLYYLYSVEGVYKAKVYDRTADAVVYFNTDRNEIIEAVKKFSFNDEKVMKLVPENTGREIANIYQEKIVNTLVLRGLNRLFVPEPIRIVITCIKSIKYVIRALRALLKGKLEVAVLDGTAILVSVLRKDYNTAGSVMFLLKIGELLEEWTHKKSVDDLARSMQLNVANVWLKTGENEVLTPVSAVRAKDMIVVHTGNMIPLDGVIVEGEAMVSQASLTGEPLPVRKDTGGYVYAGTVVEEGNIVIEVKESSGQTRYEKIVTMIEESEKLKSNVQGKAEHLADALVPYSFLGTGLTYLITKNVTKALSILMVDFSCALKLSMPIAVLSAMRECNQNKITVKGGKFLEDIAEGDTVVFDKTGTLTKASPKVAGIITFQNYERKEVLRLAACLEEHFPHSIANAVVKQAEEEELHHKEVHSKVEYIVAHGIVSYINGERAVIGSSHFVFEDEKCLVLEEEKEKFDSIPEEYSHLYLGISGRLAAVILIEDPVRKEAAEVIAELKKLGIGKVVMMTGDSEKTARAIASRVGVDEYYAEVLPEDKAKFVEEEKKQGRKVIMIGDGVNDSPALSAADVGIAISEGAEIAREIADITISENNLNSLVLLKKISMELMKRIHGNYHFVVRFNLALIILGVSGRIAPGTSALLHNMSTLAIGMKSMTDLIKK